MSELKEVMLYHALRKKENKIDVEELFVQMYQKLGSISEILVDESKLKYEPSVALELIRKTL